jgi:hypothetical protein
MPTAAAAKMIPRINQRERIVVLKEKSVINGKSLAKNEPDS